MSEELLSLGAVLDALQNDEQVDFDPENYSDPVPAPPPAGNYLFRVKQIEPKKNRNGEIVLVRNDAGVPTFPIFILRQLEIVDAGGSSPEAVGLVGRVIFPWTEVRTKEFEREDGVKASDIGRLLQAYDSSRAARTLREQIALLNEFVATGRTFPARLDWRAFDTEWAKAAFEANGGRQALQDAKNYAKINEIEKKATLLGMSKFPKRANGQYDPVWRGVNGDRNIEARPVIRRYYPSHETVTLGPVA